MTNFNSVKKFMKVFGQEVKEKPAFPNDKIVNLRYGLILEELNELKNAQKSGEIEDIEEEVGDVLFSVVNLSRFFNVAAEDMLRKANRKFIKRFKKIEQKLKEKGKKLEDSNLEEMGDIWEKSKN